MPGSLAADRAGVNRLGAYKAVTVAGVDWPRRRRVAPS
jgi:hypothetical protein